jgi:DNA (cytosine-5)-methyltransferase 1
MDSTKTITHISLCTGYGGIDLGLSRIIRGMRTVAYAEIDSFAIEVLLARMEAGQIDAAPIWTDVRDFPWGSFHGSVDILSAGYPCQPFSHAGLRKGEDDERHLWPHIKRGIEAVRPAIVFLENVEGHITMGLSTVISDLEELGYQCSWGIFSAEECGAPHRRNRVFIVATNTVCERGQLSVERIKSAIQDIGSDGAAGGIEWANFRVWPIEPVLRRSDDGTATRVDRLRLLGNGVVPATASLAFKTLLSAIHTPTNHQTLS